MVNVTEAKKLIIAYSSLFHVIFFPNPFVLSVILMWLI
jgi:hypothetical protein